MLKIVVGGDWGVGKTSLIRQFINKEPKHLMTIGTDFSVKNIEIEGQFYGKVQLWEIAGQEQFAPLRPIYHKGASGALLIFDLTRKNTLANIKTWMNEIITNAGNIPITLVGNKSDLGEAREVSSEEGKNLSKELNIPYIETSALTGENVTKAVELSMIRRDEFKVSQEEF